VLLCTLQSPPLPRQFQLFPRSQTAPRGLITDKTNATNNL
jgi:hypothetical protein